MKFLDLAASLSKTPRDKTDAEHYFKGFVVACHENGKENAMRLIKHFSSECKDDWKMESDLVNELGETEHPNILTYCWHGEGMYLAVFFLFFRVLFLEMLLFV